MNTIIKMFIVIFLLTPVLAYAGKTYTIYLKSGKVVVGTVVEETNEYIKLDAELEGGIKTYYRGDIQSVEESRKEELTPDQQKGLNKAVEVVNNNLNTTFESVQKNCTDFVEKLKKCEPYECTYVYFGGMTGKKKIIGFENNKCHSEEIAGSHKLDCRYSKATINAENPLQAAMNNGECVDADGATPIIGGHIEMGNVKP